MLSQGVNFIWVMAKVLTASFKPSGLSDNFLVDLANPLTGEDLCSFKLQAGTLADLETVLCGPCPWSQLLFYSAHEPWEALDPTMKFAPGSLFVKDASMEAWLHTFPETGKFLEAMQDSKFHPSSADFDIHWTAKSAPSVPTQKAQQLVEEVFNGPSNGPQNRQDFVRIFGKLTASGESWNMFSLQLLQNYDPGLKKFKHYVCQHWLELARDAATSMIPTAAEATPIFLLKRNCYGSVYGCCVIGNAFPDSFNDRNFQQSLLLCDLKPSTLWGNVSTALVALDWNQEEGSACLQDLLEKAADEADEFATLTKDEVCQMVHVQLRLSCCGVARVKGPINEACVKMIAKLLAYKLKILKFQSSLDLEAQLGDFKLEAQHRGTLVLVTDVPFSIGQIFAQHRTILCYKAKEPTAQSRSPGPRSQD